MVTITPQPLYPGKEPHYPWNLRPGGAQSRCEGDGEEISILPVPELEPWIVQLPRLNGIGGRSVGHWLIGSDRGKAKCLEEIASQLYTARKSHV